MKIVRRFTANATAFLALSLLALTFVTIDTKAQANRQVTAVERRIQTMDQQSKQYEIDNMGRDDKKPKVDAKRAREIKNEIAEDLNGLQKSYNDLVLVLQNGLLSEAFLRESTTTVRKMAQRLKTNLALPSPESTETMTVEAPQTSRQAARLFGKLIYDFITNPIFESTTGLDVRLAGIANRDLDRIIAFEPPVSGN